MLELNKIYNIDCLEGLKQLDDNSIDSIVTDPPYELGFMGKEWDKTGIAYNVDLWRECLRVLKPGGHLLAFGGARTYHRMACAVEDAGFEIRDCIMWIYGCVSEDTEILTLNGWKKWNEVKDGDEIFSFNIKNGMIEKDMVLEKFIYDVDEEMVNLKNDDTDQLITKNHKIIFKKYTRKQKNGIRKWEKPESWEWDFAFNLDNYTPIDLPIAGVYDGDLSIGIDFAFLLGWILSEGHFYKQSNRKNTNDIRIYQSDVNLDKVDLIRETLNKLGIKHNEYKRKRKYKNKEYTEFCFVINDKRWEERIYELIPNKKPTWQLLNLKYEEKLALFDALMLGDGNLGQKQFYQYDKNFLEWFQVFCHLIGKQARINLKKWSVAIHDKPTTQLQARHLKNRFVKYKGKVWSIRTNNMTYIARRDGKIFITGNSGFPKSLDISKAIDKKFGAERKVVGYKPTQPGLHKSRNGANHFTDDNWQGSDIKAREITAPVTHEAKQWEGWGTALKPAYEPIIVARKPISERNVAQNVLKWGTGGINIDGCRIAYKNKKDLENAKVGFKTAISSGSNKSEGWKRPAHKNYTPSEPNLQGRFPANVIFDEEAAKMLDEQSNNASRFFYCAKASKKERGEFNNHPTVKPLKLIEYLIKLVTPPDGICLDPFEGSGTHAVACKKLGFKFIGFEINPEYYIIANKRLESERG